MDSMRVDVSLSSPFRSRSNCGWGFVWYIYIHEKIFSETDKRPMSTCICDFCHSITMWHWKEYQEMNMYFLHFDDVYLLKIKCVWICLHVWENLTPQKVKFILVIVLWEDNDEFQRISECQCWLILLNCFAYAVVKILICFSTFRFAYVSVFGCLMHRELE